MDQKAKISFDYIKSPHFRVIRADGAIGGLTPNGFVHMAFYSERPAIPQRVVHELTNDGKLGREIEGEAVTRGGIVREMDCDLFLTIDAAESLSNWLSGLVQQVRSQRTSGNGQEKA